MNILKMILFILMMNTVVKADKTPNAAAEAAAAAEKAYQEEMSLAMCHSPDHHYNPQSHACVYCAQWLHYDDSKTHCVGTLNMIGKCYGEDHYHAKTRECMYCASGYAFNEDTDIRECVPIAAPEEKKKAR